MEVTMTAVVINTAKVCVNHIHAGGGKTWIDSNSDKVAFSEVTTDTVTSLQASLQAMFFFPKP